MIFTIKPEIKSTAIQLKLLNSEIEQNLYQTYILIEKT